MTVTLGSVNNLISLGSVTLEDISIVGTTAGFTAVREYGVAQGRFITDDDNDKATEAAVLGSTMAQKLFGNATAVGQTIKIGSAKFTVVGVMAAKGVVGNTDYDSRVYIPIKTVTFRNLLGWVAGVSLIVGGIGIMNIMLVSVTERTRQIGILRALGMGAGDVLRGVLAEAAWLGALGTLTGLPLGWELAQAIVSALVLWQRIEFEQLSWSAVGLIVVPVVGMGVALVAALWPARQAAQVSPLSAIHPQRENRAEQDLLRTWILGVPLGVAALAVTVWASTTAGAHTLDLNSAVMLCMLMPLITLASGMLVLPPLVAGLAELSRGLLARRLGVVGRLAGDQLAHSGHRQRTLLTAGTLTLGLAVIMLMSSTGSALVRTGGELLFGLMREDFMLMPFSSDEPLESTSLLSPQRQQEWPRGVLALLNSVRDRAYVYSMGFTNPVKEMEGNSAPNILAIDDLEAFLHVGSLRYEQGDLDTALRIVRQGHGVLITPAVARQFDLQVGSEWRLTTRRGRVPFHVAAVGLTPFWAPIVSRADSETYLGASAPFGYFVTARLDSEREMVRSRLQDRLSAFPH